MSATGMGGGGGGGEVSRNFTPVTPFIGGKVGSGGDKGGSEGGKGGGDGVGSIIESRDEEEESLSPVEEYSQSLNNVDCRL